MKTIIFLLSFFIINLLNAQITQTPLSNNQRDLFIQKANNLRATEAFKEAATYLDSILKYNPKDAPILLYKGDLMLQGKEFSKAVNVYSQLLPLKYETTIATINLSYALFMNHKTSKALQFAKQAYEKDTLNKGAIVNYFNAQLWNIKTTSAKQFLNNQQNNLALHENYILKARLFTTEGNFKKGLQFYDSAMKSYDSKYYIQENAEVLIGKKMYKVAEKVIDSNKSKFTTNEYILLSNKLKAGKTNIAGTEISYFSDVANNTRIENNFFWLQGDAKKYQFGFAAGWGFVKSGDNETTNNQFAQIEINENWSPVLKGETKLQVQLINPKLGANFNTYTGQQTIKYQANDRRMIGLFVKREVLNFTAELLENNISNNSLGYVTHLMLNGKTGFFSEGSFSKFSDKNKRYQFFGSLYKLFRTEPTLKSGLNFTALHFTDNTITKYFSPNSYLHSELFIDYSTPLPQTNNFFLQLQAATGFQKIEQSNWDNASRFQAEIGYRKKNIETGLKYQTSNVSSNNGTGYKFNWFTLRFIYKFNKAH